MFLTFLKSLTERDDKVPVPIILSDDLVAIQVGQDFNMTCEVTVDSAVRFNLNWHLPHDRELDGRVKESTTVRKKSEILNRTGNCFSYLGGSKNFSEFLGKNFGLNFIQFIFNR